MRRLILLGTALYLLLPQAALAAEEEKAFETSHENEK